MTLALTPGEKKRRKVLFKSPYRRDKGSPKKKKCLGCDSTFESYCKIHRMCGSCRERFKHLDEMDY